MIVISLLLILVAATMLVVGLVGESNVLLFGSIGLSLVAALALYLGARAASSPEETEADAEPTRGRFAGLAELDDEPLFAEATQSAGGRAVHDSTGEFRLEPRRPADPGLAEPEPDFGSAPERDFGSEPESGFRSERESGFGSAPSDLAPVEPEVDSSHNGFGAAHRETVPEAYAEAAESAEEIDSRRVADDVPAVASVPPPRLAEPDPRISDQPIAEPELLFRESFDAEATVDPEDEPEPEPATPAEGARAAQLDADVVVVDGRPRYHLVTCDHLSGREAEPLPVGEAIELGFTPCGWCRPVSSLLASSV